ncbi:MAG: hypothetical protein QOE58_2038, partial [Actinomycetota bacterium]|nr:hypothetical protein [Actinomycetota bacterium]
MAMRATPLSLQRLRRQTPTTIYIVADMRRSGHRTVGAAT